MKTELVKKRESTVEEVYRFIQKNKIPAKEGRECVDGRYDQHGVSSGLLARPGGDFGYVMILLALNIEKNLRMSPISCAEAIYTIVTENGGRFYKHTDIHTTYDGISPDQEELRTGCGHIQKALTEEFAGGYGVNPTDVKEALRYIREKLAKKENIFRENLKGEHIEEGVIINLGEKFTLEHHDKNNMYFVYDATRDEKYIEKIVEKLSIESITPEDFKRVSKQQTETTLRLLAQNKPIYQVNLDEDYPVIQKLGTVS